jgi:hypothetical protein
VRHGDARDDKRFRELRLALPKLANAHTARARRPIWCRGVAALAVLRIAVIERAFIAVVAIVLCHAARGALVAVDQSRAEGHGGPIS